MLIDICLPVKNEAKILERNLAQIFLFLQTKSFLNQQNKITWQVSVIINDSNDNSWQICNQQTLKYNSLLNCQLLKKPGKGRAIKAIWRKNVADVLVFMDADLAVSLESLDNLIMPILEKKADLVIGSRFLKTSTVKRSWQRNLISVSYLQLSRIFLQHKQSDMQCGFKAISKKFFNKIEDFLLDDYWFFDTELIMLADKFKGRIVEIPVNWQEPRKDKQKSKIKVFKDSYKFFIKLIKFKKYLRKLKNIGVINNVGIFIF